MIVNYCVFFVLILFEVRLFVCFFVLLNLLNLLNLIMASVVVSYKIVFV